MISASSACVRATPLPSTWFSNSGSDTRRMRGRSSSSGPLDLQKPHRLALRAWLPLGESIPGAVRAAPRRAVPTLPA
jgi:hypothetical protein